MPIDPDERDSDGWWLARLARKLQDRQRRLERLDAYYRGDAPLPTGAENVREAYRAFQRKARTNFAELIVEATRERMQPTGFLTAAGGDEAGDAEARRIWDGNDLDVQSGEVHEHFLALGDGYVIVGPPDGDGDDDVPVITSEDPRQVVTIHDPVRQSQVRAALKVFHDPEEGADFAYLYLPGRVAVARRDRRRAMRREAAAMDVRFSPRAWDWDEDRGGDLDVEGVPVVRFRNRRGLGEFETHLDVLDRINHQILQRMVIATMQAFRQRAVKNASMEDEEGKPIDWKDILIADPGAAWVLPGDVDVWESDQVDLRPILEAVKDDVVHLAAVTRTPLPVLIPEGANQTAEGAAFAREGLVFKAEDRIKRATQGWRDVMALAFQFAGDVERADRAQLEVLWAPAERRSLSEMADADSKASSLPLATRLRMIWGMAPAEVARVEQEQASSALIAGLAQPTADGSPDVKAAADALGTLIRSGVDPADAAQRAGLPGVRFTGAVPSGADT